jgi:hypothetical protein
MTDFYTPKSIIVAVYLFLVAVIGLFGLIAIAILNKNAEKPSVAKIVGITYAALFTIIFIFSLRSINSL